MLTLYNTAKRAKEPFTPLDPGRVRIYVCGPTVYDFAHIGNARTIVAFDQLFRLLRHVYGEAHVVYARNITDVDDKINARAAERGISITQLTEETARIFHEDMAALNVLAPTVEPRATHHIPQMIAMIERLIASGHAYPAEGHVLFEVRTMPDYGRLSGRSLDEMLAGARVDVAPYKRDPMDFVLWKPSSPELPGWESPWGRGRPGWHIECSAMSETHLGETFDIHGGGIDLVFPHHENEIAQSVCAHGGAPFAHVWMHAGFLKVEGEKMSKSLGNFHTVHDLLAAFPGEALRLHLLMTHYRQPLNWTHDGVREAVRILDRWYEIAADAPATDVPDGLLEALCDDLNTPKAIAELHRLASDARKDRTARGPFRRGCQILGLLQSGISDWKSELKERSHVIVFTESIKLDLLKVVDGFVVDVERPDEEGVWRYIAKREQARRARNFKLADSMRDQISRWGFEIRNTPDSVTLILSESRTIFSTKSVSELEALIGTGNE